MIELSRSVSVDAPVELTFAVSNDVARWPEIIPEYLKVDVFRTEGRKIWFNLTNAEGYSWVSWRMLHPPYLAYAERHDPLSPFEFNQITWTYAALPGNRTVMTWDMCFRLEPERADSADRFLDTMTRHTEANQAAMKAHIESVAAAGRQPDGPARSVRQEMST